MFIEGYKNRARPTCLNDINWTWGTSGYWRFGELYWVNADHSVKFKFRTMGSRCVGERVIEEWIAGTFRGMDISGFVISVNRAEGENVIVRWIAS